VVDSDPLGAALADPKQLLLQQFHNGVGLAAMPDSIRKHQAMKRSLMYYKPTITIWMSIEIWP
jgi:hypothetical protein